MKAIPTNVPGIHIGDHLPKIARIMDRLTVVRSLTHPYPLHGTVYATTGIPEVDTKIESQPRHHSAVAVHRFARRLLRRPAVRREVARNAAQRRVAVRDGLEERNPAAGRTVRSDARPALRSGLHGVQRRRDDARSRDRSRQGVQRSVAGNSAHRQVAAGGGGIARAGFAAPRSAAFAPRPVQSSSTRPGIAATDQHFQPTTADGLFAAHLRQDVGGARLRAGAAERARSVRHDSVRPVVSGRAATDRSGLPSS